MKPLSLLLGLLLFVSCANAKKGSNELSGDSPISEEIETLSGEYQIITLKEENISSEDIYLKIDDKGESLMINAGCNVLRVDFIQVKDRISFQPPVSTKMYCEGKMTYENTLNLILPDISEIQSSEDNLVFLSKENEVQLTVRKNKKSE
ncbi:META domain-containing protein [Gillisia sp. Q332]|uniref:META domain-containing protein n=1 Tax=Gillisia xinjiangensis TaxID=3384765 RepID=UPI00391B3527